MCSSCHGLVHAARLEQLAASARSHAERGDTAEARAAWLRALELLPADSTQAQWIRGQLQRLEATPATAPAVAGRHAWARRLGLFAPLAILLVNGKFLLALFKLKFLLSLGAFVAFYWALYGAKFGVGFAILILVHELGHFIDIKRRGLPADMPVFLPGSAPTCAGALWAFLRGHGPSSAWRVRWRVASARRCARCCGCRPVRPCGLGWPACRRCSTC